MAFSLSQLNNTAAYKRLKNLLIRKGNIVGSTPLSQQLPKRQSYGYGAGSYVPSPLQIPPPPPAPPTPIPVRYGRAYVQSTPQPAFQAQSGSFNVSGLSCIATGVAQSGYFARAFQPYPPDPAEFELDIPDESLFNQKIPQAMLSQFTVGGKNVQLKQSDYKASGGEGVVYVKNGTAYKVYHDPKKMIAPGKIQELGALKGLPNILGPQDIIYANNSPVGFTMPAINDAEFLCKLFTKGFRDKNNITPDNIAALVKIMQSVLKWIHTKDILVVDYNEMNFLTNKSFTDVYHIDVDSWQTPSYPATAIMESIRDRKVSNRKFTKESDWFSFACVAFQLYIGTHPYKGRHPDFAPKDWLQMMDQGISVFNRKCKLPPATQSLDVIPKGHLKWFEAVFEKGERSVPPEPDQVQIKAGPVQAQIVGGNDKFNIGIVQDYGSSIEALRYIDGIRYAVTQDGIYGETKKFATLVPETGYVTRRTIKDLCAVQGDTPVILEHNKLEGKLRYKTFKDVEVGLIDTDGFFVANRATYAVVRDSLMEITFRNSGAKVTAMQQSVANVFHNHQVFDGLVVQNMLNTCRFSIPYESGKCQTVRVPELDKVRIVDARYDSGIAIIMYESGGVFNRMVMVFSKDCTTYTTRLDKDVQLHDINFTVKDNGVCIATNDDKLEIFADNSKVKVVDSPLVGYEILTSFKNDTLLIGKKALHKVTSK